MPILACPPSDAAQSRPITETINRQIRLGMKRRHFQFSNGALFLLLLSIGFVLLILPRSLTQRVNFLFAETFDPLLRLGRRFPENALMPSPHDQFVSRQEHNTLWKNYKNLHAQLTKLQEEYNTIARIRSSLPRFYSGLVAADIAGLTMGLKHEILINKGTNDGVRNGCYVMSPDHNSIIGVVRETSDSMSRVRLLTDANQQIEVRIRRDGTTVDIPAMMTGNGKDGCIISLVEREKDVRPGDAVYAAPRPGLLDTPVIIGQVTSVMPDEESPLLWKIFVQPTEIPATLKTVAVVVPEAIETGRR